MHNVSERWAIGGTARLGPGGGERAVTGLALRGRRWLTDDVALDVSTGATFVEHSTATTWGHETGLMADARINFRDDAYVGLRFEEIALDPFTDPHGGYDRGGRARALSLLLGTGSEWALGTSAALGLGLLALIALVDWQ
jgi:hypothetical protein